MNKTDQIGRAIRQTLNYFDLFDFPLTREELFRFLWQTRIEYWEFCDFLARSDRLSPYTTKFGYYFLPGREEIVEARRRALVPSEQKLRQVQRSLWLLRSIPFLRAIFVCNSVGTETARGESDIDLFIITEKGRIWLVRFFANFILRLFGRRTYGDKQKNRLCLSFFADTENLNLFSRRAVEEDIHFIYWLQFMVPIFDQAGCYEKFFRANEWVKQYLPNVKISSDREEVQMRKIGSIFGRIWKKIWEIMWQSGYGDLLEKQAKNFQIQKMKLSLKEKAKVADNGVILSDGIIKLHEKDTRKVIKEKWLGKIV